MTHAILLNGPSSAGKSTLSKELQRRLAGKGVEAEIISMADYIEKLKKTTQYVEANVWSKVIFKELLSAREHMMFFLQFVEDYAQKIGDERRPYALETWEKAYEEWSKS